MIVRLKAFALMLGVFGLLAAPSGAGDNLRNRAIDGTTPDRPGLVLAGGGSLLATGNQSSAVPEDSQSPAPQIIISDPLFDFGQVLEGTEVVHDFLVENRGAGDLAIDQVRTGWGCTAVSFPRQIPAGGEDKIRIKIDTKGYGGRQMKKTATVYSNDPFQPQLALTLRGQVDKFAQIKPEHVIIRGYAGDSLRRRITVVPSPENPFTITGVKAKHGTNIKIAWEAQETPEGKTYVVEVENTRQVKGRYYDTVYLMTDSALRPRIPVQVRGSIAAKPQNPKKTP